jgi:hypothetical protein
VARGNGLRATKVQRRVGHVAGLSPAYLIAYHADRMMRTVMRMSVQASISAVQMSANSLKYVTVYSWHYGLRMSASILVLNSRDSMTAFSVAALASANSARSRRMKSAHSCWLSAAARIASCPIEKWDCGMCRSRTVWGVEHEPLSTTDARWPLPVMNERVAEQGEMQ